MFLLYAVLAGLIAGLILGGNLLRLAAIRLRWTWLIVAGMAIQGLLYSEPVSNRVAQLGPEVGPSLYIASMVMVLAAVVRNAAVPGLPLVALGAASNLAAIVANGGYMPASAAALGDHVPTGGGYSNSAVMDNPALPFLTDIFALPDWLPAGNVFSIGDVLIGVGIAMAIVVQMRRGRGVDAPVVLIATWPKGLDPAAPRTAGRASAPHEMGPIARPEAARCGPATPPSGRRQ